MIEVIIMYAAVYVAVGVGVGVVVLASEAHKGPPLAENDFWNYLFFVGVFAAAGAPVLALQCVGWSFRLAGLVAGLAALAAGLLAEEFRKGYRAVRRLGV